MTGHGEWFKDMQNLERPGYVDIGDDTAHAIKLTGDVPLTMQDGKVKYLADVLHVPTITKNLVSAVGQMVEQNLQVRFTPAGVRRRRTCYCSRKKGWQNVYSGCRCSRGKGCHVCAGYRCCCRY